MTQHSLLPIAFDHVSTWFHQGALGPLAGLYIATKIADIFLISVVDALRPHRWLSTRPRRLRRWLRQFFIPLWTLQEILPAISITDRHAHVIDHTRRGSRIQEAIVIATDSALEELLFRGVPYAIGTATVLPTLWLLAVGTMIWAFAHGTKRGLVMTLTGGPFFLACWATGHPLLAIGFHAVGNIGVKLLAVGNTVVRRRRSTAEGPS